MTQIEDKMHTAVCNAVALMNRTQSREPTFHEAHTILRQALMDYTPSPASPTRSDTREPAAASPSAVAEEAQYFADSLRCYCKGYRLNHEDTMLLHRAADFLAALSSQAPKPASAGGDFAAGIKAAADWVRSRHDAWFSENGYIEPDTNAASFGSGPHAHAKEEYDCELTEIEEGIRAIAAEADTAKCPDCGNGWNLITECQNEGHPHRVSADRLAPIEARGVVTDVEVERALDIWCNKPVTDDTNLPKSLRDRSRAVLETFLRARESAPAVDPFADKYHELLMAVASKFPGESRHATALRYINERETVASQPGRVVSETKP